MPEPLVLAPFDMPELLRQRPNEWALNEGRALEVLLASQLFDEVYPPFDRAFQGVPFQPSGLFPYSHFGADLFPDGTEKAFHTLAVPLNAYETDGALTEAVVHAAEWSPTAAPASFRHIARIHGWLAFLQPLGTTPRLVLPGVSLAGPYGTVYPVIDAVRLEDDENGWSETWGLALRTASLAQLRATGARLLFCVPR